MFCITQAIKVMIVVCPAIFPLIAFFFQIRKGNPFCWFWLVGGVVMATGLALTIRAFGWEKLQNL